MGDASSVQVAGPAEGQLLGEYRVERCLAAGGFGSVYLASSVKLEGRKVIIKVIHVAEEDARATLRHEAAQLVQLRHPSMVQVITFGEEPGFQYLVMEYIDGQTLADLLEATGPLGAFEAVRIGAKIAEALEAVHEAKVIHRDLKPANIMLRLSKDRGRYIDWLKLIDFGIAAAVNADDATPAGTPEYVAPETVRQQGEPVTHATDLYALGCILFEMLTGRVPFQGQTPQETVTLQARGEVPHVGAVHGGIPPELDELVFQLLQKSPAQRPPSALAVTKALGKIERGLAEGATGIRRLPSELAAAPAPPQAAVPTMRLDRGPSTLQALAEVKRKPRRGGWAAAAVVLVGALAAWWVGRAPGPVALNDPPGPPPTVTKPKPLAEVSPRPTPPPRLPPAPSPAVVDELPDLAPPATTPSKTPRASAVVVPKRHIAISDKDCVADAQWAKDRLRDLDELSAMSAKNHSVGAVEMEGLERTLSTAIAQAQTSHDCVKVTELMDALRARVMK